MRLLDALYNGAMARIEAKIRELSAACVDGAMKDFESYRKQTGIIAGLKMAQSALTAERRALTQPEQKKETENQDGAD